MASCLGDPSSLVRDTAADCLSKLHEPAAIMLWGRPDKFMSSFWIISSQVLFILAKHLLDTREGENGLRKLLDLLKRLLISRNQFLEQHRDLASQGVDTRERLPASINLEVALLVLLCSYDTNICELSIDCFGLLCTEAHLTEPIDDPQPSSIPIVQNMSFYTELTKSIGVVPGRKSLQRRIRQLLPKTNYSSPGLLAAWEEVYKRWKLLTPIIVRLPEDIQARDEPYMHHDGKKGNSASWHGKLRNNSSRHLAQTMPTSNPMDFIANDRSAEWQNYTGFLTALGGVCMMQDASNSNRDSVPPSPSISVQSRSNNDSSSSGHSRPVSGSIETSVMADRFVTDMIDLIACDNLIVREWVREILGNDLSPALYHIMFRHLEAVISKCFSPDTHEPRCGPTYTLFVEQAISVLKQVLDRVTDKTESLVTVDFSTLIKQYALYISKLGRDQLTIKIKIKMCQLVEVLMSKKDKVTLRQEFGLRNKLLEIIVEWTSDFALVNETKITVLQLTF